jgi:sensor histidine kinase YesM
MQVSEILATVFAIISAYLFFQLKRTRQVLTRRMKELERLRNEASEKLELLELEKTKFQLNPHFFRNSLTTLQNMINKSLMSVEKLSEVLEYALYDSQSNYVSLTKEFEFAQKFTEYNETRTGAKFEVRFVAEVSEYDPLKDLNLIAPMITAYFIENAFKHSDVKSEDGFVHVFMKLHKGILTFDVRNRARKSEIPKVKGGLGKDNIQKRLSTYYKNRFSVRYDYNEVTRIHAAILTINLDHEKSTMHTAG